MSSRLGKSSQQVVGQARRLPIYRSGRRSACPTNLLSILVSVVVPILSCFAKENEQPKKKPAPPGMAQVPTWSQDDLNFFLHGSMSTEVIPEAVLRAFINTYPDLFPTQDLSHLGLIPDSEFGWPIGLVGRK